MKKEIQKLREERQKLLTQAQDIQDKIHYLETESVLPQLKEKYESKFFIIDYEINEELEVKEYYKTLEYISKSPYISAQKITLSDNGIDIRDVMILATNLDDLKEISKYEFQIQLEKTIEKINKTWLELV